MNTIRVAGAALVGVLVLVATVVASASAALPEFEHCVKLTGGKFAAGCTAAGSGFEKEAVPSGSKITLTSKGGEAHFFTPSSLDLKIACEKSSSEGEITGPKTVKGMIVTFEGCRARDEATSEECEVKSVGPVRNEIITAKLEGALGYIKKSEKTAGLLLKTEVGSFAKLVGTCLPTTEEDEVTGSVIAEVATNSISTTGTLKFKVNAENKQVPTKLEGEISGHQLKVFGQVETGLQSESTATFGEAIEVKA